MLPSTDFFPAGSALDKSHSNSGPRRQHSKLYRLIDSGVAIIKPIGFPFGSSEQRTGTSTLATNPLGNLTLDTFMKLLIRNLDRATTAGELKKVFQEFGAIQSCTIVMDPQSGESKGFGFIEMPKPGEAKAAIKSLNNKKIGRNAIRVKKAINKKAKGDADKANPDPDSSKPAEKV